MTDTAAASSSQHQARWGAEDERGTLNLIDPAHNGTHVDALSHVFAEGKMYNDFDAASFTAPVGAGRCGIENTGGFASRVVLDHAEHQGTALRFAARDLILNITGRSTSDLEALAARLRRELGPNAAARLGALLLGKPERTA